MSKIDDLINKLCPDGVEYYSVKEFIKSKVIFTVTPSFKIKRNDYKKTGLTPIISQEIEYISGYCNKNDVKIMQREYVCFGDHSENIKYVDFAFVQGADGLKIICTDKSKLITKYFYYSVLNFYKRHNNYERHFKYFCDTIIPIPPLEIQREIVRILDSYSEKNTQLIEELYAEMDLRKKQYEYYRDMLLNFDDSVEWRTLGNIAIVTKLAGFEFTKYVTYSDYGHIIALRGLNVKNGHLVLDDVKYIDNSDFSKLNRSKLYINDMLFTYVGTVGQVALITENDKYYLAPNVALIRISKDYILPDFMMYFFQSEHLYYKQIEQLSQNSSMKNLTMEKIRKFQIPIPPIEEQERIVKILDRFDSLCNDLTDGLPAEINARQKQYEYYRDKLLQFKIKST